MAPEVMQQLHGYDFKWVNQTCAIFLRNFCKFHFSRFYLFDYKQSRYLVIWHNCVGTCAWPCSIFKVSSYEGVPLKIHLSKLHLQLFFILVSTLTLKMISFIIGAAYDLAKCTSRSWLWKGQEILKGSRLSFQIYPIKLNCCVVVYKNDCFVCVVLQRLDCHLLSEGSKEASHFRKAFETPFL